MSLQHHKVKVFYPLPAFHLIPPKNEIFHRLSFFINCSETVQNLSNTQ